MELSEFALLLGAAVIGGALNSVAGGGSFFTFPALVFVGVPAVPANATSAVALWPGSVASAVAYRRALAGTRSLLVWLGGASLAGGVAGAVLLVMTPSAVFERLVPFLLLLATVLFAAGPKLTARLRAGKSPAQELSLRSGTAAQFVISTYGGYFGGGMGMMMLAGYSLMGMTDLHRMNGIKAFTSVLINGSALATFVSAGIIDWPKGLLMTAGAIIGGYGGAVVARRIRQEVLRTFVIVSGFALTAVFFVRAL